MFSALRIGYSEIGSRRLKHCFNRGSAKVLRNQGGRATAWIGHSCAMVAATLLFEGFLPSHRDQGMSEYRYRNAS